MSLRILHTADHHLGISFGQYPDDVRQHLLEERFAALQRLVDIANERQAHFLVVAGDLFDKQGVPKKLVKRAVEILAAFDGEHVLVLPGNHDFCEGPASNLWTEFRALAEGTRVLALLEPAAKEFDAGDVRVRFYPCPCPAKHGRDHVIGWVAAEEKEPGLLHVGIAHGNVEGLGLDANQQYFNMSERELRSAGVHTWLLGHIHVPAPAAGTTGRPAYFMAGIHTPDSLKCSHAGHAWWIELESDGSCRFESVVRGRVRFARIGRVLDGAAAVDALRAECARFDAPSTILDLQLDGRLGEADFDDLRHLIGELRGRFLHLTSDLSIAPLLDAAGIERRFPDGTLTGDLLRALLSDEAHPGDAHVALETIEPLLRP